MPIAHPLLGTLPKTQECALTGNQTSYPLVRRPVLNPLSHTSQGQFVFLYPFTFSPTLSPSFPSGNCENVLCIYESVSVMLVHLFCFLDSIVSRYVFIAILFIFLYFLLLPLFLLPLLLVLLLLKDPFSFHIILVWCR